MLSLHRAVSSALPALRVLASQRNLWQEAWVLVYEAARDTDIPVFARALVMTSCDMSTLFCKRSAMICLA